MTAQRDPDEFMKAILEEGLTELPDRVYEAVRSEIDHTRQRVVIGPWRVPYMNNFARYGIAAAAIIVVVAIGAYVLPRMGGVAGPGATATASPTAIPSSTSDATKLVRGDLAPGTYVMDDPPFTQDARVVFTVPAGWAATDASDIAKGDGSGEVALHAWAVTHIYGDVCQWRDTLVSVGTTVDELVDGLAAQTGRTGSAPTEVTLGGFSGKRIELVTPEQEAALCHGGIFRYWPDPGPNENGGLMSNRGNHADAVYVLDVAGNRLVIVARRYADSTVADGAELDAIVESIRIEP